MVLGRCDRKTKRGRDSCGRGRASIDVDGEVCIAGEDIKARVSRSWTEKRGSLGPWPSDAGKGA